MKRFSTFLAIAVFSAAAIPGRAAFDAYMQIKGQKQGQFKGAGKSKSNRLPILTISHEIVSPRDPQSGLPTGQRMHKPIVFTVAPENGIEFQRAMQTGELLPAVQIEFIRPAAGAKVEQYYTIQLKEARISSYQTHKSGTGGGSITVEVQMTYQQITWTYNKGKIQSADDWTM